MNSFETKSHALALGAALAKEIPERAAGSISAGAWTKAVYDSLLAHTQNQQRWKIYPEVKPYLGEYLLRTQTCCFPCFGSIKISGGETFTVLFGIRSS
jgi:hypothetical protein